MVEEAAARRDERARRRALLDELRTVEQQWLRVRAGLAELGPGERRQWRLQCR